MRQRAGNSQTIYETRQTCSEIAAFLERLLAEHLFVSGVRMRCEEASRV